MSAFKTRNGAVAVKHLAAVLTLGAIGLVSKNSLASFEICNTKSDGATMYVTYAYYEPDATTDYFNACGDYYYTISPAYWTLWRNTGWWYLTPNQCATVYSPALANTWGYVYAQISDGSTLTGANTPFTVANTAFTLDQYTNGPLDCSGFSCSPQSITDYVCPSGYSTWSVETLPVDQGSSQNYKLNIY
jgi:uncharacterized membrane protein